MMNRWPHTGAFVLQFQLDTDPRTSAFQGRIEHVASGRAMRFHTIEELQTFVAELLNDMRAREEEAGPDLKAGPPG
jgi:hypothetical protein